MKKKIENFLTFCDKHGLSFEVKYRSDHHNPEARFFLIFGTYHNLQFIPPDKDELKDFSFSNGYTPNEAIENCINELEGTCLGFRVVENQEHIQRLAVFK